MSGVFNIKLLAIVIIAILIIAGVSAYIVLKEDEEKDLIKETEEFELDDSISPYTTQGLIVEVSRIRNRNLLDKMLVVGTSWRDTPSFYWTVDVDGKEGNSKGTVGASGVYTSWDTFGEESSMSFYVNEEKESSNVKIYIVEQIKSGFLKRKSTDIEKELIDITYDYRTGRWNGADSLKDSDGLGHYLGEEYEIWFNVYQSDYDHDGIPYWIEKNILKTNPTVDDRQLDPDNDCIPTAWEWKWDYNPFEYNDHKNLDPDVDGIDNFEEYVMRKWFSNPYQPDIYIETDGMKKKGIFDVKHIFFKEAQQMLIERFAQHGINVYIDDGWPDGPINGGGEMLPFYEDLDDVEAKQGVALYNHHFADERKGIFRYVIIAHKAGLIHPSEYNMMDTIIIGSNLNSILTTKAAFTPRHVKVALAKAILHEMGHSIGLLPITFAGNDIQPRDWGDRYPNMSDKDYEKFVDQYHSIMNYNYINLDRTLFDYSDGSNGEPYDQNDWDYIYIPTFQIDGISYEEPVDETFEDFEIVNDYPGVILEDWELIEEMNSNVENEINDLVNVKNTDIKISVYKEKDGDKIRIYAMPEVEPTHAVWSLVSEGELNEDGDVEFYSLYDEYKNYL